MKTQGEAEADWGRQDALKQCGKNTGHERNTERRLLSLMGRKKSDFLGTQETYNSEGTYASCVCTDLQAVLYACAYAARPAAMHAELRVW